MAEDYIGPYRIVEKLGSGGMGEVFKARDERLERWVAIKRIRPGKEGAEETRERFQREAKATAQLNHPAIVHVYDIFQDGDSDCIVMEFIEGRTLQSYCAEKSLDPMHAASLGRQIAEGLAEAHSKKILHRDLKTENVIVTPEGQAKILDFGLAKPLMTGDLDDPHLTGKGQLVGTSRAMSPEYVGGDLVDHRSDLFSLGVLLYELVTGRSPFKAQNTLATLKQVIIHHQVPARELNAEVSQELSDLIDRLLEKLPADRPANARIVADELAMIAGQFSGSFDSISSQFRMNGELSESWASVSSTIVDPRYRRYWVIFSLVLTVALVGAFLLGRSKPTPVPADGEASVAVETEKKIQPILVVLGEFATKSPDVEESLIDLIKEAFRISLEQSRNVRILSEIQIRDALKRMEADPTTQITREVGVEIGVRENAKFLILGQIVKLGDAYSISAEITDPTADESVFIASQKAENDTGLLDALDVIAQKIRENLGDSSITSNEQPLHKVTTRDLEALKAYTAGITRWNQGELEKAAPLFQRAIDLDPEFAMAHAKLAVVYNNLARDNTEILYHVQEALKRPKRLTEYERLYIQGWEANWLKPPGELIRTWDLVRNLYPDLLNGHYNTAMGLWLYRLDFDEAAEAFDQSIRLSHGEVQTDATVHLAYCRTALSDWEAAAEILQDPLGERVVPHEINLKAASAIRLDRNSWTENRKLEFDVRPMPLLEISESHDQYARVAALYYLDTGRFQSALQVLERHVEDPIDPTDFSAWITVLQRLGEEDRMLDMMQRALERGNEMRGDLPPAQRDQPIPFLAVLGKIQARQGLRTEAQEILQELNQQVKSYEEPFWQSYLEILRGEINAARGDQASATKRFEDSLDLIDSVQAHESLAHLYETSGINESALIEAVWIASQRGQVFSECSFCFVSFQNVVAWQDSMLRLGRLLKDSDPEQAQLVYQQLLSHWKDAEPSEFLEEARRGLEETSAAMQ